jgi:hypothetical protein
MHGRALACTCAVRARRHHLYREKRVNQRSPAVDDLVRRLIQHEAGGARDAESLGTAIGAACLKLSGELETLVGRGGVAALLGRAVNLSKREFPFLGAVHVQLEAPVALDGLRDALQGCSPVDAEAASIALLANLVGLLVSLLGEELGLRPVTSVWPNLLPEAGAPASREM